MTITYHSRCLLSQKYPFDNLLFIPRTVDVYKASRLLTPPRGKEGKHNSHSRIQDERKQRCSSFFTTLKRLNTFFVKALYYAMLSRHSQVNIVLYLEERLKSNLKNIKGERKKKERKKTCFLPLKVYPISQCSGCGFEAKKATWMTHNCGVQIRDFYPCSQTISALMSGPVGF